MVKVFVLIWPKFEKIDTMCSEMFRKGKNFMDTQIHFVIIAVLSVTVLFRMYD